MSLHLSIVTEEYEPHPFPLTKKHIDSIADWGVDGIVALSGDQMFTTCPPEHQREILLRTIKQCNEQIIDLIAKKQYLIAREKNVK